VVYYANFLKYFERARTEYLRERGIEVAAYATVGLWFVVTHVEVDYRSPARYNDLLRIETEIADITRTTFTFAHVVDRHGDERLIAEGWATLVCVDEGGRPRRVPDEIVQSLASIP
jgi:acyl-CoA thioester hydrolase